MLERLDFWITLFSLGAAVYFLGWKDFLEPKIMPIVRWLQAQTRTPAFTAENEGEAQQEANERTNEPVRSVQRAGDLVLNSEEIAGIARMISHNRSAVKPTKSSTIAAGFGVNRGGTERYRRASQLYDLMFSAPVEILYPTLAEQRKKQQLSN